MNEKISKRLVYDYYQIESADSGINIIRSAKVWQGRIYISRVIAIVNKTSAFTKINIGIYENGVFYCYFTEASPVAAECYFTTDEIILREGQQVQAEFVGCTLGDELSMYIHGIWNKSEWVENG